MFYSPPNLIYTVVFKMQTDFAGTDFAGTDFTFLKHFYIKLI